MGVLVLFQILVGRLSLFMVKYYFDCGFVLNSFYYIEICSLYTHFHKFFFFFIMNGCCVLSNAVSISIEMIMWFLSFVDVGAHIG